MNRNGLWIVTTAVAVWISFLLGYAVSSHTGVKPAAAAKAAAGGYGCGAEKGSVPCGKGERK